MRILHVTKKYPDAIGGDATCVFNLEREQSKIGHKVFILTTNCREIINRENIYKFGLSDVSYNWDQITAKRLLSLLVFFPKSFFVLKKIKPDIIHTHSADLGFIISYWAKLLRIPVINTCHGITFPYHFLSKFKRYSEWFFLKFGLFTKIISVDPGSMKFFKQYGLRNYEYVSMLGVDTQAFQKIKEKVAVSKKDQNIKFIFVGRLDPLKGLDYLIKAAAKLKELHKHFEVWIIGDGQDKDRLKSMSVELGVDNYFKFFGAITSREKLMEMYCLADIFVLPSLLEGFPLTILEACAASLAVIATDVGGIKNIFNGVIDFLVIPPGDTVALLDALVAAIKDLKFCRTAGIKGRQLVEQEYNWGIISRNLDCNYRVL